MNGQDEGGGHGLLIALIGLLVGAVMAPFLFLLPLLAGISAAAGGSECKFVDEAYTDPSAQTGTHTSASVPGYSPQQMDWAMLIMQAYNSINWSPAWVADRSQPYIAVAAALAVSGLDNADHGLRDAGALGIFQLGPSWGTAEDRMNVWTAATLFYNQLNGITPGGDWAQAAAAASGDDASLFTPEILDTATTIVDAIVHSINADLSYPDECKAETKYVKETLKKGGDVVGDYAYPVPPIVPSSCYGPRTAPTSGATTQHNAVDLPWSCGTPITAVHDGTVTQASGGSSKDDVGIIFIDHGDGYRSRYLHMWSSGIYVHKGDHVTAGQVIGEVGLSGVTTGCHLDFGIWTGPNYHDDINPITFMRAHGIELDATHKCQA